MAVLVAPAAPAAFAQDEILARGHVLDDFAGLGIAHHGAAGHLDDEVLAPLAGAAGALPVLPVGGGVFSFIAEVHQGGEIVIHPQHDGAAVAAVAAVRPARGHVFLPVEGHRAVAAVAGLDEDPYLIYKHNSS